DDGTTTFTPLIIVSTDSIDGLDFYYNLLPNSDLTSGSLGSLIDNTELRMRAVGINATDTVTQVPLDTTSFKSGESILDAWVKGAGLSGSSNQFQNFTIHIEFEITPLYEALTNFSTLTPPSFAFGTEGLTDVFKTSWFPELSNPNVNLTTDPTDVALLGNVGWFDENYNGVANPNSVVSVAYQNTSGDPESSILYNAPTDFTFILNQPTAVAGSSKYTLNWAWIPEDLTLVSENHFWNNENLMECFSPVIDTTTGATTFTGKTNSVGAKMDINFTDLSISGTEVTITGRFQPNSDFVDFIEGLPTTEWNFIVWVSLADHTQPTNLSNRVSQLVDFNQFGEVELPTISADLNDETLLNHAQPLGSLGSTNIYGAVEDELNFETTLFLQTITNNTVSEIEFVVEGVNDVTGEEFTCETDTIDVSGFPLDGTGTQLITVNKTRGFQMASGVDKNIISINRDPSKDVGGKKAFVVQYSFRLRWEYWVENNLVPDVFTILDPDTFNGKNQNWARLDSVFLDWKLSFALKTKQSFVFAGETTNVNTKNSFPITVATYEESSVWTGSITHFDETGTDSLFLGVDADGVRQNAILSGAKTLVQADFDLKDITGDVGSISNYYGVIRIEIFETGGINGIEFLSSVLTNVNGILKPVAGETGCKIEKISATKIRLTGLIDESFITSGTSYKTSARIGNKNISLLGIYAPQYDVQYA
ncbi:MAG: hypothetical protein ACYTFG_19215, partial [Planctomycetota bacterium]